MEAMVSITWLSTSRRQYCVLVGLVVGVSTMLLLQSDLRPEPSKPVHHDVKAIEVIKAIKPISRPLELAFGDLPGYTGWARPAQTSAPYYEVLVDSSINDDYCHGHPRQNQNVDSHLQPAVAFTTVAACTQEPWTLQIRCSNQQKCQRSNALFDVRAYGPTLLSGIVQHQIEHKKPLTPSNSSLLGQGNEQSHYDVTFYFPTPGRYTVEIVLAFSDVDPLKSFPTQKYEPDYEGYLLPDMPIFVDVQNKAPDVQISRNTDQGSSLVRKNRTTCEAHDILQTSLTSRLEQGAWTVVERVRGGVLKGNSSSSKLGLFADYQNGVSSVGFRADYVHQNCRLISLDEGLKRLSAQKNSATSNNAKVLHVLFVGDSNLREQHNEFVKQTSSMRSMIKVSLLTTEDGITKKMPEIKSTVARLIKEKKDNEALYVMFNSGLHDVGKLCHSSYREFRNAALRVTSDADFVCVDQYRKSMIEFVATLKLLPASLLVFQTNTAGWNRWGVYGGAWMPNQMQKYPKTPQTCFEFNRIAWEIMKVKKISVLDTYWLSLARPDHRQIWEDNRLPPKLVHLGKELYNVMLREWLTVILSTHTNL